MSYLTDIINAYIEYTKDTMPDHNDPIVRMFEDEMEKEVRESQCLEEIRDAQKAVTEARQERFKVLRK